jgi:hypothetical protein
MDLIETLKQRRKSQLRGGDHVDSGGGATGMDTGKILDLPFLINQNK